MFKIGGDLQSRKHKQSRRDRSALGVSGVPDLNLRTRGAQSAQTFFKKGKVNSQK